MKRFYIGIDTSNYTTSCALFEASERKFYSNVKELLIVEEGQRGLKQSDALFAHVKNLPGVVKEALSSLENDKLCAIGVSATPRSVEGSYMPCFLAGVTTASAMSDLSKKPLYKFSHQDGHVMAAVWSSGSPDLLQKKFIAFHVSGGTTEMLLVSPKSCGGFEITKIGGTMDLNAGQAIDRVGVKLGLTFPCGAKLEELALCNKEKIGKGKISVKGCECNLSGLENLADKLISLGKTREYIAAYLFDFVGRTIITLTENAVSDFGKYPILYAGGVMSNSIIKNMIRAEGFDARFAEPKFSSDNAAGCALLCAAAQEGYGFWTK